MKKFLIAIFFIGLLSVAWYPMALRPVYGSEDSRVIVRIPQGASVSTIAGLLKEKKLIRSPLAFRLYTRFSGLQSKLKAGSCVLKQSMSVPDVISVLRQGCPDETIITIPEGYTVKDIDALLAEKQFIKPGDLILCAENCDFSAFSFLPSSPRLASRGGRLEGYLYPDTYFAISDGFKPEDFLSRLLTTFQDRVVTGLEKDLSASKRSLHEIITMASLVEEETRTNQERPIVAGILWKRLDAKQSLGVDAAVRYILDKPTSTITKADLDVDSPYNLRKVTGLPPGPIASPSVSSIKAAAHPEDSPYWYYLHGSDGQIHYAVTNDEHNRNRALYLP